LIAGHWQIVSSNFRHQQWQFGGIELQSLPSRLSGIPQWSANELRHKIRQKRFWDQLVRLHGLDQFRPFIQLGFELLYLIGQFEAGNMIPNGIGTKQGLGINWYGWESSNRAIIGRTFEREHSIMV
jgi:hypothetical protein